MKNFMPTRGSWLSAPKRASARPLTLGSKKMKHILLIMLAMSSLAGAETNLVSQTEILGQDTMIPIADATTPDIAVQEATNDYPSLEIIAHMEAPAITLRDAISLAEAYIATNGISTDGFWLKEVKLVFPDKGEIRSQRWHALWVNEDAALGHTISIMIEMNGRAWRMASL